MANTSKKPKMGRPPLPPEKRKRPSMGFRPTAEMRRELEEIAAASGLSLTQEIERRLEQTFQEDKALGGRQFRALFSLFGNAAVLIEQQTGKSYFEDYYTYVAVRAAWRRLIAGFGPSLPAENIVAFEQAAAPPVPKLPMLPAPPTPPQQLKDYDAAMVIYKKESAEYEKAGEALRRIVEDVQAQMALGKDVAVSLLPERPKKKA